MNSWDNYYKEFESGLSGDVEKFCISLKETEENVLLLESLGYSFADNAETISDVDIGQYSFHEYEEFDENEEVTVCEESVEIYHKHSRLMEDLPNKEFVEKWFGIKQELILGITGGF